MSVTVHEFARDFKCRHFRDLVTIQGLLEGGQEIEDSDWLRAAEADTLHLVPDATGPLAAFAWVKISNCYFFNYKFN